MVANTIQTEDRVTKVQKKKLIEGTNLKVEVSF
jgi:hypothetical protein